MLLYHATSINAATAIVQSKSFVTCQMFERPDRGLFLHEDAQIARNLAKCKGAVLVFQWPRDSVRHFSLLPVWSKLAANEVHGLGRIGYSETPARYILPYCEGQTISLIHIIVDHIVPQSWMSRLQRHRENYVMSFADCVGDGITITLA